MRVKGIRYSWNKYDKIIPDQIMLKRSGWYFRWFALRQELMVEDLFDVVSVGSVSL